MKIALYLLSALIILLSIGLIAFGKSETGNVTWDKVSVPIAAFVLCIGLALNPSVQDLVKYWLKSRVDIARAEHHAPGESAGMPVSKPTAPPPIPPEPTDTAKG